LKAFKLRNRNNEILIANKDFLFNG